MRPELRTNLNREWESWLLHTKPLFDLSSDIMLCLSLNYDIVELNHPAEKYYNWQRNNVIGKNFINLCKNSEIASIFLEHLPQISPTNPLSSIKEVALSQNKDEFIIIEWSAACLSNHLNEIFGFVIVGKKNIQNTFAEKQLKRLQNQLDTIVDVIPGSVYWKDKEGVYLGCNNVIIEKGNLSNKSDLIGKTDYDVWPEKANTIRANDLEVMEAGKTLELEETVVLPSGERMYFASVKKPVTDEAGEVIGIVCNSLDITELKEAKERAEVANYAKTQFLAVASHELRIPLTGIISTASMLAEGDINTEEAKEFGKVILNSGTYLLANLISILDFTQLEAERFELITLPVDLKRLIEEIILTLTASAKDKGLELFIVYEPNTPHNIFSDARALRQIVFNLISNAIKFTQKGFVAVKVRCLQQEERTAQLEIAVEDTGIGIPKDKFNFIFDRFSQIEDAYIRNNSRYGTGLGLSIIKRLVSLLNGEIKVVSEVGKGSTFYFTAEYFLQNNAVKELPWTSYASDVKILVIDDTLRGEVICKHLGSICCNTIPGDKAFDTLLTAQQLGKPYDVIIVDSQLSTYDPVKLLQAINHNKNLKKPMPILIQAGSLSIAKQYARENGFFDTLIKPIQPIALQIELTSAWERWLEYSKKQENFSA